VRFPYQGYPVPWHPDGIVYRPAVNLTIIGPTGQQQTTVALADTGSDVTLMTDLYVPKLGVDLGPTEAIIGIGGQLVSVRFGDVELELRRPTQLFRWRARVAFHPGLYDFLGHDGFFDLFIVGFNSHRRQLTIKPIATAQATVQVKQIR
jgi:hypothetical protein